MGVVRRKVSNAEGQRHWTNISPNVAYGNIRGLRGAGHQTVVELGWDDVGIVAQRAAAGSIGGVRLLCGFGFGPVLTFMSMETTCSQSSLRRTKAHGAEGYYL